jgi:hypothetical protein
VFVEDAFDFVDDSCSLPDQVLPEIGELPNLGVLGIGGKNTPDVVRAQPAQEPLPVVPEQRTQGIGISFVGLVHGGIVGLNDDYFSASGFFEFFEQPVVKATDFDDGHVASVLPGFFGEIGEKFVNFVMIGTDLAFLNDFSAFVPDIDCQLVFVLVDSKVQHGRSPWVKGFL